MTAAARGAHRHSRAIVTSTDKKTLPHPVRSLHVSGPRTVPFPPARYSIHSRSNPASSSRSCASTGSGTPDPTGSRRQSLRAASACAGNTPAVCRPRIRSQTRWSMTVYWRSLSAAKSAAIELMGHRLQPLLLAGCQSTGVKLSGQARDHGARRPTGTGATRTSRRHSQQPGLDAVQLAQRAATLVDGLQLRVTGRGSFGQCATRSRGAVGARWRSSALVSGTSGRGRCAGFLDAGSHCRSLRLIDPPDPIPRHSSGPAWPTWSSVCRCSSTPLGWNK